MHIPDGYLSPKTCLLFYAGMIPVWFVASRKVEKTLKLKDLPLLALGGAFTFVIMMFNIPIPGGSSGHMVGATIVSIVLGPWAGVVALSLTLTLQAFLFADGGLMTLGANCFNMAFIMSFSGYYIYSFFSALTPKSMRFAAASLASYIAVNLAALAVAIELGLQPLIAHSVDGRPLYAPYPLLITIPAMMAPHLLFFGPVEALGTSLVVSYISKTDESLLERKGFRPLWAFLILLIILTPVGLMASGTSWGEWGKTEISRLVGYVPSGMERLNDRWGGVMPHYNYPGAGGTGSVFFYIISAALGSFGVVLLIMLWGKLWRR